MDKFSTYVYTVTNNIDLFGMSLFTCLALGTCTNVRFDIFSIRKFKCTVCGRRFKTQIELERHTKVEHELKSP